MPGVVEAQQPKASRVRGGGAAKVSSSVLSQSMQKILITCAHQDCLVGILGACICSECCEVSFFFASFAVCVLIFLQGICDCIADIVCG